MPFNELLDELAFASATAEAASMRLVATYLNSEAYVHAPIRSSVADVGFRIRPYLLALACQLSGKNLQEFEDVAGAIELMQASTLVTDDFLDDADTRNRKPSLPRALGPARAILIGEMLKSLASTALLEASAKLATSGVALKCVEILEEAYFRVCLGQYCDLEFEARTDVTEAEYFQMITDTTATFIRAPLIIGALVVDLDGEVCDALSEYGISLGIAYQIRDDVIDLIGDPELTGKPFAGDIRQRKKRLPLIHALTTSPAEVEEELINLLQQVGPESDSRELDRIVSIIRDNGSIQYAMDKTRRLCESARESLADVPDGKPKRMLSALGDLISCFDT